MFVRNSIVTIEISDEKITICEFEKSGKKLALASMASKELPKGYIAHGEIQQKLKCIEIIKGLLASSSPKPIKTRVVALIFPESKIFLHVFHFAKGMTPEEMIKSVPLEATSFVPFDPSQIYCDFYELTRRVEETRREVLYIATPKKITDDYFDLLRECDLQPVIFSMPGDAYRDALLPEYTKEFLNCIVGFANDKRVVVACVDHGEVRNSLSFSYKDLDAQILASKIRSAIEELKAVYIREEGESPKMQVYIEEREEKVLRELKSHFNAEVNLVNPYKGIEGADLLKQEEISSALFGIAKTYFFGSPFVERFNLLPQRWKQHSVLYQLASFITSLSIIMIIAASAFMAVFSFAWSQLIFDLNEARVENKSISQSLVSTRYNEIQDLIYSFNAEVDLLTRAQSKMFHFYIIFDKLLDQLKKNNITGMQYLPKDSRIDITGIVNTREELLALQNELKKSPYISEIVSPLSNFDQPKNISFILKLKLKRDSLPYY